MNDKETTIRDRVAEIVEMRLGDLLHNPSNWKTHPPSQKAQIEGVIRDIGFGDVVKAYRSEKLNGQLVLLDGHGRKEVAPDAVVKVAVLDFDDEEADRYLATFDLVGEAAETDPEAWLALVDGMDVHGAVADMVAEKTAAENLLAVIAAPPEDFPEYDDEISTDFCCPKCGYEWSGSPV